MHIVEWPLIVTGPRHTCEITVLFNQHLYRLLRWMDYIGKGELLTFNKFANKMCEKYFFAFTQKVSDLLLQLKKTKVWHFLFLFSVVVV